VIKQAVLSRPGGNTIGRLRALRWPSLVARVSGGGLLMATGAIHLDLYLTGYRTIPTIGWLFLVQVITAFSLGLAVLALPIRLAPAAGAGFAAATLGGYLLSLRIGLFGFREVRTSVGIVAGVIEVAAFATLSWSALRPAGSGPPGRSASAPGRLPARLQAALPLARRTAVALTALAGLLLGLALAATGPASTAPSASRAVLNLARIGGVPVLTNARGFTLYLFVPDPPNKSTCYGTCAAYWPPVTGTPTAGAGVTGKLGTIPRSGGGNQATYDGHPLYTYVGDSAPGQASGNNITLNGGLWREIVVR
jgi:predicted lipoprotein with Yx(FWY)xxD motif